MGFGEKLSVRSKDVATSLVRYQRWPWKRPRSYATFGARPTCGAPKSWPRHCSSSRSPHTSSPRWCLGASHCEVVPLQPAKLLQLRCLSGSFSWETTIFLVESWWNGKIPPWKSWVISIYRIVGFFMNFHDFSWNGKAGKAPLPILWMALWQRHLHSVWCASHHSWKRWCPHGDCPMCHFLDRNCWSMLIWTPIFVQKIGSIDWFLPIQKAHESSIFPGLHSGSCQPQMKPWLVEYFCAGGCAVLFLETITTYIRGRIRASHSRFSLIHPTLSTIAMFDNFEILRNLSIQQENTHPLTIGVFFSEVLPWFELPSGYVKIAIENGHL